MLPHDASCEEMDDEELASLKRLDFLSWYGVGYQMTLGRQQATGPAGAPAEGLCSQGQGRCVRFRRVPWECDRPRVRP